MMTKEQVQAIALVTPREDSKLLASTCLALYEREELGRMRLEQAQAIIMALNEAVKVGNEREERLRAALEPFGECAAPFGKDWLDADKIACEPYEDGHGNGHLLFALKVAHFREARAAFKETATPEASGASRE